MMCYKCGPRVSAEFQVTVQGNLIMPVCPECLMKLVKAGLPDTSWRPLPTRKGVSNGPEARNKLRADIRKPLPSHDSGPHRTA